MERPRDLVLLGKVTKPHGIRGELKVYPYSGEPENFLQYTKVLLAENEHAAPVSFTVEGARVQKNCVLVRLAGCTDRNGSEALVNWLVYVDSEDLPEPGEHEFYLRDLENKQMVTTDGRLVGIIVNIINSNGQDLARVVDGKQEYLIPLVPEFLISIDKESVQVSLPPGLLDINL